MKTYKLHLIRHGITEGNLKGQYIGRTELPVTPEGIAMLKNLKEQLDYPFVDRVYSSPMLRCRQTANMLYPEREITLIDNLIEYGYFIIGFLSLVYFIVLMLSSRPILADIHLHVSAFCIH